MQEFYTILWFISGIAGFHLLLVLPPKLEGENPCTWVWIVILGPPVFIMAVIMAIEIAIKKSE